MKIGKDNKGFSMMELVLVIAILAIIASIAIVTYSSLTHNMKMRSDKISAGNIVSALRGWYQDGLSDPLKYEEIKSFLVALSENKTVKLSDMKEMGVKDFLVPNYVPTSLFDNNGQIVSGQEFYIGLIGDKDNAKFVITIETEMDRIDELNSNSVVDYDGYSAGIVFIES